MGYDTRVEADRSQIGGGSCPGEYLDTFVTSLAHPEKSAAEIEEALRHGEIPIIARIAKDRVLLDPRTLQEGDRARILDAFSQLR